MKTLEVPATLEHLEEASQFVLEEIDHQCTPEENMEIALVVEELFVNIVKYAYYPASGMAWISCEYDSSKSELTIEFRDEGIPFNPLNMLHPDIESDVMNRKIGSLGIYLVTKCMDTVEYEHRESSNILTLRKTFDTVGGESVGI